MLELQTEPRLRSLGFSRNSINLDHNVFFFALGLLALADFNMRRCWIVSRYETSVSQAIDMVLFAEVVFVKEPCAHARNADKKSSCICFLNFTLCQWLRPRTVFHDGRSPGIRISKTIGPESGGAGRWESLEELLTIQITPTASFQAIFI